jgi:uncharacterized protein YdhG (YjbR/CyaY superfamily)
LRATLRKLLPHADEAIKYGMPCFVVEGKGVAAYDAFKDHCSYFPMGGTILTRVSGIPEGWATSKGTLQFPPDRPLPVALVKELVRARLDVFAEVVNGKCVMLYDDGSVKAEGSMKGGQANGAWKWYRRDGTLMRTGRFKAGEQVGAWETWDRTGRLVKTTTI